MQKHKSSTAILTHFIHANFLPLLVLTYIVSAVLPQFGLWLRHVSLGTISLPGLGQTNISIGLIMLSFLLFNAGLGIQTKELLGIKKKPMLLIVGFLANMIVPMLLIVGLRGILGLWHSQDELHNLIVGLALIIAMPIAGSAATWAQNANGNLSLSLGLVLLSTVLSPLTTPLVLHTFGFMTQGDYAEDLHEMAQQGTNAFLCLTVVLPSLLGIIVHYCIGENITSKIKPNLKLINFIVLLLLNYSNASTSLPEAFSKPDWDLLAFILAITVFVCSTAFFAGWVVSKVFKSDGPDKASLMFGLGMNNNGTGLVLAATALADHPAVMLPMIFYTLVQQIIAAIVDRKIFRAQE